MPFERFQKFSQGDVPQLYVSLLTAQGQGLAVRSKGHIFDHAPQVFAEYRVRIWILQRLRLLPGLGRPEDRRPIAAAAGQQLSVPGEIERNTEVRVSLQTTHQSARGDLPDL